MAAFFDQNLSGIKVHLKLFLGHLHLLIVVVWNIKDCLDSKRDISAVMKLVFKWNLGVGKMFIELLIFILSHISLVAEPDSLQAVDNLVVQLNGVLVENRVLLNYFVYLKLP